MSASLTGLSASVTRILYLTGFSKELKTKDIQSVFAEWESAGGGFKIKWRDDTSLLIVFQDASVAKRAYLHTIAFPPASLTSPDGTQAVIRPYDGPDAQNVIQTVNLRNQHGSVSRRAASISGFPTSASFSGHGRAGSLAIAPNGSNPFRNPQLTMPTSISEGQIADGREPSPTLPSLPSHPTLNSLISSSLGDNVHQNVDPAILAAGIQGDILAGGPRIGDPGKRMLGAALGVRHPGLGPRVFNGAGGPGMNSRQIEKAMGGLIVAE